MIEKIGICMSGESAVEFLEMLPDCIDEEVKENKFCEDYERMLNRVRYLVRQSVPVEPGVMEPISKKYDRFYTCGQCGFGIRPDIYHFCPKCGRAINWKAIFPERAF